MDARAGQTGLAGWAESRMLMECYQTTDLDALPGAHLLPAPLTELRLK